MRNLVWSSNSHVENKMVCRIKKKYIGREEKTKQRHVVPVQVRLESILAILLRGCVPA